MKKHMGAIFLGLCLLQGSASGQDCIKTINQGAATVTLGLYEQSCPTMTFSSGVITKDVKYNCCGQSATIRVNGSDWNRLMAEGKLDGLRYQKIDHADQSYTLTFRKVVGTQPTTINGEDFFK